MSVNNSWAELLQAENRAKYNFNMLKQSLEDSKKADKIEPVHSSDRIEPVHPNDDSLDAFQDDS